MSNRVPTTAFPASDEERRAQPVGGLVSAVRAALESHTGMWFGWSGTTTERRTSSTPDISEIGPINLVTVDLSADEVNLFYTVFANRSLWPTLHSFPTMVTVRHDAYRAYQRVNRKFAEALLPMLEKGDLIWVHDYHLISFGRELRRLGWTGKIGFFLHTPFPSTEIFGVLPAADELLRGFEAYDLVGLHTARYKQNLLDALSTELEGEVEGSFFTGSERSTKVGVFPIGTDPANFEQWSLKAEQEQADTFIQRLLSRRSPSPRRPKIILGVDRLDYTKGIPQRLLTFEQLLERHPSLRGTVTLVQISAPSRTRVPEYIRERERVDQLVGRINGRFSEADWAPVHYLYRSYTQPELARFYREADVCLVTPLRDGMNLVAMEFVASQGPDPGVLILSRFCGASETMPDAVTVNPYDSEGTAEALYRALMMDGTERKRRWESLMSGVRSRTAISWSEGFLDELSATTSIESFQPALAEVAGRAAST
ncbi:MAG: trehalose-6-phosphate synthase [Dehalococcoidia bacterium]|nr:trehalose-6-phosphate synthase [Dehalococcoidia bacterium]